MDTVIKNVRREGTATIVEAAGEIDMRLSPDFHQALIQLCEQRPGCLLIHMAAVSYIDSSGVGALVDVLRRVRAYQGKLALVAPAPRVKSMLEITKLNQFFTILATEQEAFST